MHFRELFVKNKLSIINDNKKNVKKRVTKLLLYDNAFNLLIV